MKKATAVSFALLAMSVVTLTVVVARRTARAEDAPVVVPGSELSHNEARAKPGYSFVNRINSVDVVKLPTNQIMGTYVCPCTRANKTGSCEIVFQPRFLTCKGGSCIGETCRLTAAPRTMRQ